MARETKNEDRKQRIRDAFQEGQAVERMPAREDMQPQNSEDVELRVAPYCRVSTMSEMQAESFEIQQQYYSECIAKHPNWVLVRIYADEGISATSVKNRKEFNQMILTYERVPFRLSRCESDAADIQCSRGSHCAIVYSL